MSSKTSDMTISVKLLCTIIGILVTISIFAWNITKDKIDTSAETSYQMQIMTQNQLKELNDQIIKISTELNIVKTRLEVYMYWDDHNEAAISGPIPDNK